MGQPCEEPLVRAVFVVQLESDEETPPQSCRAEGHALSEQSQTDAEALGRSKTVHGPGKQRDTMRPKPA